MTPYSFKQPLFEIPIARPSGTKRLEHLPEFLRRCHQLVKIQNHRSLDGLRRLDRRGVRLDPHDSFSKCLLGSEQLDCVVIAFAHFCAIDSRDHRPILADACLRQLEHIAIQFVHLCRDVASHFQVLLLIPPDRNQVCIVKKNIRCHQHGIRKQPMRRRESPGHLVLERVTPLKQPHRRDCAQDPSQLGYLRHVRLTEKYRTRRVQPTCKEVQRKIPYIRTHGLGIPHRCQSMQVRNKVKRLASLLQLDRRLHHAEIIAQMR